jgi:hypothetical protein
MSPTPAASDGHRQVGHGISQWTDRSASRPHSSREVGVLVEELVVLLVQLAAKRSAGRRVRGAAADRHRADRDRGRIAFGAPGGLAGEELRV